MLLNCLSVSIGRPHADPGHIDFVPSVFPNAYKKTRKDEQSEKRYSRVLKRRFNKALNPEAEETHKKGESGEAGCSRTMEEEVMVATNLEASEENERGTQTCVSGCDLEKENTELKEKLKDATFSVCIIEGNSQLTTFYTGLPSWVVFLHLFNFVSPYVPPGRSLIPIDEFFLVLMRLRLNLMLVDLSVRFKISVSLVNKIISKWVDVLYERLKFLISWPPREIVQQNMPPLFKELFPNSRCIIDCSEIFIEIPTSFDARAKTFSNYKKHNTVKFLVGITPCGVISFLSKCWGGRASDKTITQESGFFNRIEPGDVILADRGFAIQDDIAVYGAKLIISSFTRGKKQLSLEDVERSKQLSQVRIHVERVIGFLKNKFTILKGPIPVNVIKHNTDIDIANIDKLLVICSALVNISDRIV